MNTRLLAYASSALLAACSAATPSPAAEATTRPATATVAPPRSAAPPSASARVSVEVVAGNGNRGGNGDGGRATDAELDRPAGLALGTDGSLYIAECEGNRVRHVDSSGVIKTIAGRESQRGFAGDGGPAVDAQFACPFAVAADDSANVYVADVYNHRIRRVDNRGIVTTVIGTGTAADTGDGGPPTDASINLPGEVVLLRDGGLLVASGSFIRTITAEGIVETIAGLGSAEWPPGHWVATMDGEPAIQAAFTDSGGMDVAADGTLYFASFGERRVFSIDPAGTIHAIAGTGSPATTGDGGPAIEAALNYPSDVAVGPDGSVYILEHYGGVRRVTPDGLISAFALDWFYDEAQGVVADDDYLYIADRDHDQVIRAALP